MPHLIALIGPAGVGKTTLAYQLSIFRSYVRKPFAGYIKGMLSTFLGMQGLDSIEIERMLYGDLKEESTPYFCGRSPRHAMQTLGTEWRNLIHKNLWVDAWTMDAKAALGCGVNVVVDDCRHVHEVNRVRELGGKAVLIRREGYGPGLHSSEKDYLEISPDFTITNNGTKESLIRQFSSWLPEFDRD